MCGAVYKESQSTNKGRVIGCLNIVRYWTAIGGKLEVPNTDVTYETLDISGSQIGKALYSKLYSISSFFYWLSYTWMAYTSQHQ